MSRANYKLFENISKARGKRELMANSSFIIEENTSAMIVHYAQKSAYKTVHKAQKGRIEKNSKKIQKRGWQFDLNSV